MRRKRLRQKESLNNNKRRLDMKLGKHKRRPPLQQMRRQFSIHPLPLFSRMEHNNQCQVKINQMIHQPHNKLPIYLQKKELRKLARHTISQRAKH
jgi:hypothetical protein